MDWLKKFRERKFWMAVVGGLIVIFRDGLGIEADWATVLAFAGIISTWIIKEAELDKTRIEIEAQKAIYGQQPK